MDPNYVQITVQEYLQLKADQEQLNGLKARGVDNWEGYSDTDDFDWDDHYDSDEN